MGNDVFEELEARVAADPIRYHLFNPAQIRAIRALEDPEVVVLVIAMGNGTGKTFSTFGGILGAILFGTANPLFAGKVYREWPYPKDLRIVSTSKGVEDNQPIQIAMRRLWPRGKWEQARGSGKGYWSQGTTTTGWRWDTMTYNQSPQEFAAATKGLIACSEPPPPSIFGELVARLRAGGLLIVEMTPLTYAAYLKDLVDEGVLRAEDGSVVGKVAMVGGDIHENCREHVLGGQLPHDAIERTIALWPVEEREARRSGSFMHLAGLIYRQWGEINELAGLSEYHAKCWDQGKVNLHCVLDPHDRKPFALAWKALFPNDDRITLAEWPDDSLPMFHKMVNSPLSDIEEYRELILATEAELGVTPNRRIIDPNFGNTPKAGMGKTVKQMFAEPCRRCGPTKIDCPHRLFFEDAPDSIPDGHLMVRRAIGNPKEGIRPKLYALKACRNSCFGMRRYGYRENKDPSKGLSEVPELVFKDFPDLDRYDIMAVPHYEEPAGKLELWKPVKRGRGWHVS